ncbi:MAG: putative DNA binding domain-containing protein [bacterium]|nr:putative DNA binding domain-containing protein [bacterium]
MTIIKRSPIVPLRMFLIVEILALVVFLIATRFDSLKFQLYSSFFLSRFFSYETTKFLLLSLTQFVITVYAFLSWHYESYSVRPSILSHRWGVFFKKEKIFPLHPSMSITVSAGPLGKRLHYGSIRIEGAPGREPVLLADIARPDDFTRALRRSLHPEEEYFHAKPDAEKLLSAEEHERLEFKSSLRFDYKSGQVNRDLEKAALKTVAAFLNTRGGHLVIGVNDRREPLGLQSDYRTLRRSDSDGFENHFTQVFNAAIGPEFRHLVKLWFSPARGATLCVVQVAPSPRPVYLKFDDNEHFYVRTGNVTTPLKLSEVETYRKSRWSSRSVASV